jgi:hypothetical protein
VLCTLEQFKRLKKLCPAIEKTKIALTDWDGFDVKPVPGRGRGLVALRHYKPGDHIFTERPILYVFDSSWTFFSVNDQQGEVGKKAGELSEEENRRKTMQVKGRLEDRMADAVRRLDPEDQKTFWGLGNAKSGMGRVTGRVHTNGLPGFVNLNKKDDEDDEDGGDGGRGTMVFRTAAYMNHRFVLFLLSVNPSLTIKRSCRSNTYFQWDTETFSASVFASRDIYAGEEITLGYLKRGLSFEERQKSLMQHFGFRCNCELCKLRGDDERSRGGSGWLSWFS